MILTLLIIAFLIVLTQKNLALGLICTIITYPTTCLFSISKLSVPLFMVLYFAGYICLHYSQVVSQNRRTILKTKLSGLRSLTHKQIQNTIRGVHKNPIQNFYFLVPYTVALVSFICSALFGPYAHPSNLISAVTGYLLVLCVWILFPATAKATKLFYKVMMAYLIICCVVGAIEAVTGISPFAELLLDKGTIADLGGDNSERTGFNRTRSLTIWCETYGTMISAFLVCVYIYAYRGIVKMNRSLILLGIVVFFSVFTTNSRSMLLTLVISMMGAAPLVLKSKQSITVFICIGIGIVTIGGPIIYNVIDSIIHHEDAGGSSLEMRFEQFASVMIVTAEHLPFGNGMGSQTEMLEQYGEVFELNGFESIVFTTIVQRGLFGLFSVFLLWIYALMYAWKYCEKWLIFLVLGFMFSKIMTLTPSLNEEYILLLLIPMSRMSSQIKTQKASCVSQVKLA